MNKSVQKKPLNPNEIFPYLRFFNFNFLNCLYSIDRNKKIKKKAVYWFHY